MRRALAIFLAFQRDTGHAHPHRDAAIRNYRRPARSDGQERGGDRSGDRGAAARGRAGSAVRYSAAPILEGRRVAHRAAGYSLVHDPPYRTCRARAAQTSYRVQVGRGRHRLAGSSRPDPRDPTLTRSFKAIPNFGHRVLRVVHRPDGDDILVITAHLDRGASP